MKGQHVRELKYRYASEVRGEVPTVFQILFESEVRPSACPVRPVRHVRFHVLCSTRQLIDAVLASQKGLLPRS